MAEPLPRIRGRRTRPNYDLLFDRVDLVESQLDHLSVRLSRLIYRPFQTVFRPTQAELRDGLTICTLRPPAGFEAIEAIEAIAAIEAIEAIEAITPGPCTRAASIGRPRVGARS